MTHHRWTRRGTTVLVAVLTLGAGSPAGGGPPALPPPALDPRLPDHATGWIEVEIRGREGRSPAPSLAGHDTRNTVAVGDIVFTTIQAAAMAQVANHPLVERIRPVSRPIADAVAGQGVTFAAADQWQAFGVTGNGTKIAVIDAGFSGFQARQAGGDLPSALSTVNFCGSGLNGFSDTSHGTAVAEIVHEMAPQATLHLICVSTGGDLAEAVDYAIANEIDIINESLSWWPPGRGDGSGFLQPILEEAAAAGIIWVNSAGNVSRNHWSGTFTDTDIDGWHNFGGGGDFGEQNGFTLENDEFVYVVLRWDDWPVSDHDYAVYLYDSSNNLLYDTETGDAQPQTGAEEPLDWFTFVNPYPSATNFYVKIREVSAATAPQLDLFVTSLDFIGVSQSGRSITDPGSSPLVVAVGAAEWTDGALESFSSRGPNIDGVLKPDLTGPDGVSGATYGLYSNGLGFYGTSASAPHVAGAFALLVDAAPCLDSAATEELLISLTEDRGIVGPDGAYGAGLLRLGNPATVADTTGCVLRRSGTNRYGTAAAISAAQFPSGADIVFVSTGLGFPDGLAGAAVAAKLGAPLLLTDKNNLPPETATELNRLSPDTIVVLGGSGVVADTVLTALEGYAPTVTRVFGNNRYDTAVAISQYGFPTPPAGTVFVTTGLNFPDALAAGAAAAELGGTVLLVPGTSLPDSVAAELVRLDPADIVIVGGISAVSQDVFDAIEALQGDDTVIRISGGDRYITATNLSAYAFPGGTDGAFVATGLNFPDALAGAAAAGAAGWPVLLVPGSAVPAVVNAEIDRLGLESLFVLGGTGAVTAVVERALEDGLG